MNWYLWKFGPLARSANHGFILLVTPFSNTGNERLTYISSLRREDAITVLKEWLIRASGEEEWMKHIK